MATLPLAAILVSGSLAGCSGSDSGKVPVNEWTDDVCDLADDANEAVSALSMRVLALFFDEKYTDDRAAMRDELLDIFETVRDSRDDLATGFGKLGQPDMKDGKAIRELMLERLEDGRKDVDEAIEAIKKLDPDSASFEDDLNVIFEGPETRQPLRSILQERAKENGDITGLIAAFDTDRDCAAIVLDGADPGDPAPEPTESATATAPGNTPSTGATPGRSATAGATAPQPSGPVVSQTSRSNPAPIGTAVEVAGWRIVVNSVMPDATKLILDGNSFNDPPAEGRQFFIANISATYIATDPESSSLFFDLDISALGPSAVEYTGIGDYCGVIPDEIDSFKDVFEGGTITGNICWSVTASDAADLLMWAEEFLDEDQRAWFSLKR